MISFKYLVFGILGLYIFGFATVLIYENRSVEQIQTLRGLHSTNVNFHQTPYKFTNPALAYAVLSQLEHIEEFNVRTGFNNKTQARPYMSLKKDDHYCDKRRAFFVQFPETVFKEITFVNDLGPKTLMRNKVLTPIGTDVQPYLKGHMPKEDQTLYDIDPSVNNFFTRMALYTSNKIGQHYSCLSQVSSHLPGKQVLDKKDDLAEAVIEYGGRFEERPQCFNNNKFFPKTFLLYKKEDCKEFFKVFNSPQYLEAKKEKKIVYMKKIGRGAHMGAGVDPVTDKIEAELKKTYDNGKKCGKVNSKVLIQNFIHNPLLLNGRKFDFRMYMFVASSNPLIAFYHDGFLRVSLVPYDVDSTDKKSLLTNLALSNQIYDDAKTGNLFEGMSIEEMKHAQQWNFERLQEYLLSTGVITDPNWLDNYLRPEFKKAMIHLLRFGLVSPFEHSSVYQLYGIDFMLDADLNLWFIEANSAPGLGGYSQVLDKQIVKMLKDEIEIVMGLLRSRMKRVINYVNELIENGSVIENEQGEVVIKHFETNKAMFDKIAQNYFEEEFKPSEENGFSKIIDGNYKGAEKYLGFISEECL